MTLAGYAGYDQSPDGVLSRDLEGLLRDGDPRWATPTRAQVTATTPQAFREAVGAAARHRADRGVGVRRRRRGPGGRGDRQDVRRAARRAPADTRAAPVRFPAHVATPVVRTHEGADNQAAAVIAWPTGGGADGIAESAAARRAGAGVQRPAVRPAALGGGGELHAFGAEPVAGGAGERRPADRDRAGGAGQGRAVLPPGARDRRRPGRQAGRRRTSSSGRCCRYTQPIIRQSSGNQFWLRELAGAAFDPRRIAATEQLGEGIRAITPASLQAAAAKYLRPERDWTLKVVPKGK